MEQIKGRITANKFIDWINSEFERLGINKYKAIKCERTFYRQDDYESGAARLIIKVHKLDMPIDSFFSCFHFSCFYKLSEYQEYIKSGYHLYFKFKHDNFLTNMEVEVRKQNNIS